MFCRCRDIQVRFGSQTVLDIARLDISAGRVCAIVGANGAGKTTLLEVMALLRKPDRGTVALWGVSGGPPDRSSVVMVMHPGYLFRGTVGRNVLYGLRARGAGRRAARQRAAEALEAVGLAGLARRHVAGLSAGERQRVNLARAIAVRPRALLLDEPTANVDLQSTAVIADALRRLHDAGTTIVHTTPSGNGLADITDRVVNLNRGQIVPAVGP